MYFRSLFEHSHHNSTQTDNPRTLRFCAPLFSQTCAHSIPQLLPFDVLPQNTRGIGGGCSLATSHPAFAIPAFHSPAGGSNRRNDTSVLSSLKTHNFKLLTESLTSLPTTLTSNGTIRRKTAPVIPLSMTLTKNSGRGEYQYRKKLQGRGLV